jgi:hypothetical protein
MAEIVAGTKELSDKIQKLLKLVDGKDLTDCLMTGGLVVERRMKENITKQNLIDTGNLRASVSAEPEGQGRVGRYGRSHHRPSQRDLCCDP